MIHRIYWMLAGCLVGVVGYGETNEFLFWREKGKPMEFGGFVGERLRANVEGWLVPAPAANPGLLGMFAVRDRMPAPNLVPWAGEFAGKYLISAVQAMRMEPGHREVEPVARWVVERLIASQAEDGYLGPFKKEERLRGHWDLWGHYHCMLGLLMWHEEMGSTEALAAARKAADLVCNTYLVTGRRAIEAGSDEMNLAVIHSLGWLYRITKEERYWRMMREIEKDWERGGDYLRAGLEGVEFFASKRPRWESLHNLQGLVELYRITGEKKYREAFEHHWRSIARWDLRNTGGFSSGEQATGNPYAGTPIETCCTIAWMAMSVDMLGLVGDSKVADLLELATWNAWAGAQHPSGRWCTYNTPMDGVREASAHTIVFQSRHGTPELNCCSVNGPRGWGMLSEWAFMRSEDGYVVNWLAPSGANFSDGKRFVVSGNYPADGSVEIRVEVPKEKEFALRVRVPEWAKRTRAWVNGKELNGVKDGGYVAVTRKWRSGDVVKLNLPMEARVVPGARDAVGKVSVYRGPLLLAMDQRFNSSDEPSVLDVAKLQLLETMAEKTEDAIGRVFEPILLVQATDVKGKSVRLCDFASAGALGTRYWSWLGATNVAPGPVATRVPRDGATIAMGTKLFRWTRAETNAMQFLQIGEDADFRSAPLVEMTVSGREGLVEIDSKFARSGWWYWRVVARNEFGVTAGSGPNARFRLDAKLPPIAETLPVRREGEIVRHDGLLGFDGKGKKLFQVGEWPEEVYAVSFRFRLRAHPTNRLGQLFSAWVAPMDDPLRVTVEGGKISARMEAGAGYATAGVPVEVGRWYEVVARKEGSQLALFLEGKERASTTVPDFVSSQAKDFALGGNPHFNGNEFVAAEVEKLVFSGE